MMHCKAQNKEVSMKRPFHNPFPEDTYFNYVYQMIEIVERLEADYKTLKRRNPNHRLLFKIRHEIKHFTKMAEYFYKKNYEVKAEREAAQKEIAAHMPPSMKSRLMTLQNQIKSANANPYK